MKILITNTYASPAGGVESYLAGIIPHLVSNGFQLALVTAHKPEVAISTLIPHKTPCWHLDESGIEAVVNAIREWSPSVVYSHGMADPIPETRISALFPMVYLNHNYGGVCASGTRLLTSPWARPCTWKMGIGCLGGWMPMRCGGLNIVKFVKSLKREISRQTLFRNTRIICVASRYMRSLMIKHGVPESKVRLLPLFAPNGDREVVPPVPRPFSNTILLAGRLTRLKGWTHVVPAVSMATRVLARRLTLVVAGDGPDRDNLIRLAAKWNVPLDFRGWLEPESLRNLMRQVDLLAVPSLWPEPFGLVGIEAGCVGTPAVAYGVGGIPDWLIPGVSGEMAPADNLRPRPLTDAIVRALRDTGHWQSLREGAWRQAGMFSRESHMERLLPILQEAATSR